MSDKKTVVNFSFTLQNGSTKNVKFDLDDGKEALFRFLLSYQPEISYADLTRYIESKYDANGKSITPYFD